jgi:hypothetical protein
MLIKVMIWACSLIFLTFFSTPRIPAAEKVIIGEVEKITILPWGINIAARIDSGASISSIDVRDFVISGKRVKFRLPERAGGQQLELPHLGWRMVKSAGAGGQRRPVVEMEICLGGKKIKTPVTLSNRSLMEYPMVVGRQAIAGNFLIDVSQSNIHHSTCTQEEKP